jgi:two-component system phosphate regulon response regulator PhoB
MDSDRILVVEDEPDIRELVELHLGQAGFTVEGAERGAEALRILHEEPPDLLILDLMLPDLSGTELLRAVREERRSRKLPVIILTDKSEEVDRVVGFEPNVDDYVTKPFSPRELVLRVRAVLRRADDPGGDDEVHAVHHEISLDRARHRCEVQGDVIDLTATEFGLLKTLFARPGRVYTREQLLEDVWGAGAHATVRTIDTHMKCLGQKLGPAGRWIATVRGVGYRLEE